MKEKTYDELEFTDDFLFCHILVENEDLCIELVEMITGRKIKSIVKPESQKSIRLTHDGKGVRFDVYFEDEENVIYDIEMQASRKYNLRKRSRYYQGMIDLNILGKSKDYGNLKDSYIIFICTFDEFGDGRHIYTFENTCQENPEIKLKDGTHKIFLCAGGDKDDCSEKMKDFLEYISSRKTDGELSKRLQDEVEKSRKHMEWRDDYMTLLEHYKERFDDGFDEGFDEGYNEGFNKGHNEGFNDGLNKGFNDGLNKGFNDGHNLGFSEGHNEGFIEGQEQERQNTEKERKRADAAETRESAVMAELEKYKAKYGKL